MSLPVRSAAFGIALGLALTLLPQGTSAQNLAFSLFERYLESLRKQGGIPGFTGVVIQDGVILWERGFGVRSMDGNLPATADTPYSVGGLTQAVSATLALRCVESGAVGLDVPVARWAPQAPAGLTIGQLLGHRAPGEDFRYDEARFSLLTPIVEDCSDNSVAEAVASEVLDRLAMGRSVPGADLVVPGAEIRERFSGAALAHYAAVMAEAASPYRVDRSGRATRTDLPPSSLTASSGLIASGRDMAGFAAALFDGTLINEDSRQLAWTNQLTAAGRATPAGLGWFVQTYRGETVAWQFGSVPNAYSSLLLVLPNRRLAFILLANSDGLSAPFPLAAGDVTASPFAQLFLGTFLP
ncbi:MAG: serine hydrolase domain-containing protein [Vicinamibacterales bacterium]